ncbi:hypothetical protein [Flavobacterium aquicola]|uniref:Uncharacterized protein n=1 Tax=Flavobacterium aquicola TaxID=1682742 RepID=A0A3E0E7R0_9FLAO|nr:hypothetical protein [Flavobacterium aquicola]REG93036.1 hypothetical protein C8P67_114139 [Flavobacterium aquicola]
MGIQTARKGVYRLGNCIEIRNFPVFGKECAGVIYRRYETAEAEFADKTMIKIVVLVREFRTGIVSVMTGFLGKFFL